MKSIVLIGIALMALLPATAFARGRAVVVVGPAFAPYGWYSWYVPYYGPYAYGPYHAATAGELKLDSKLKDADVFINGSYAGTIGQLKTMMMRPGNYDISIRAPGRAPFEEKVYIVAGKTVKLRPDLRVQPPSASTAG
jgi:hypothetical protein